MIEAEWWDYDDMDELAEAVAGDVGFIIESALDARGQALIALPGGKTPLPVTEQVYGELLSLPLHPGLQPEDVERVCSAVQNFFSPINR